MNSNLEYADLWKKYNQENDEQARNELITNYLYLVKYHTGRINMLVPNFIDKEDLESYGIVGLIEAVQNFDYKRGIKFSTFADKRIKGAIIDHLRDLDWLPTSLRRDAKKITKSVKNLKEKLGRKPTFSEIKREVDISEKRLKTIYNKLYNSDWISLNKEVGDSEIKDFIEGDKVSKPADEYANKHSQEILKNALKNLSEQEYLVITLYYYEELTQKEIASVLEVSAPRVSQIHKKAVQRLRGRLSRKKSELLEI